MAITLAEPSDEFLRVAAGQAAVYRQYAALTAAMPLDSDCGLGGKLVFAGDLTAGSDLLRAANIAGAASLAASDDSVAQRAAMRDGVVDFLVTSLDEALRILKNEIRKRQPVSVSIGLPADEVVLQMLERGVLPDLLPSTALHEDADRSFLDLGSRPIPDHAVESYLFWAIEGDFSRWMPRLDACVRESLTANLQQQRWQQFSSRYLGRPARRLHGVSLDEEDAARLRRVLEELLTSAIAEGEEVPDVSFGTVAG